MNCSLGEMAAPTPSAPLLFCSSALPMSSAHLVQEALRRPEHPGGPRQLSGHDAAHRYRGLERPPSDLAAERDEERVTRLGHSAEDDHDLRIEDVDHVGDTDPQEL